MRVLVVSDISVNPAESYSQVHVCQILRQLLAAGHDVAYAYLQGERYAYSAAVGEMFQRLGLKFLGLQSTQALAAAQTDVLYLTHLWQLGTLQQGIALAEAWRHHGAGHPAIVYDSHDCLYKAVAPFLPATAATALIAAEARMRALADVSVLISDRERSDAIARFGLDPDRVRVLSPAVDLYPRGFTRPFSQREGLCFVGFPHPSNVQALQYFLREVFPLILRQRPGLHLKIIGSGTHLLKLAFPEAITRQLSVLGYVPDLADAMSRCQMLVAPILEGAGVKGKILESMARGTPVVCTSKAVEGMTVSDGNQLLTADDPESFCAKVLQLDEDEALWSGLQQRGRSLIESRYAPDSLTREMQGLLAVIGRSGAATG